MRCLEDFLLENLQRLRHPTKHIMIHVSKLCTTSPYRVELFQHHQESEVIEVTTLKAEKNADHPKEGRIERMKAANIVQLLVLT
ncbi:unnamed protein product [Cylicostephanus goldi]|uniref:Uncharacterized protein n=1 Tax=Cylicostephanus goldi TaxID=71465 RepID=A0A3P6SQ19_CYLGO|nr:unnamed protein product [Cylicostephanus goldi]